MSNLRRYNHKGLSYFTTNVTLDRKPFLVDNIDLLHNTLARANELFDFEISAWVILPDHFHFLVYQRSTDLSRVLKGFKQGLGLAPIARGCKCALAESGSYDSGTTSLEIKKTSIGTLIIYITILLNMVSSGARLITGIHRFAIS